MKEEKARSNAKRNFTSSVNSFNLLHGDDASIDLLGRAFDKVERCWELLENAQTAFIDATDIEDIETDPKGLPYINESETHYQGVLRKYNQSTKDATVAERTHLTNIAETKAKDDDERRAKLAAEEKAAKDVREKGERLDRFLSEKVEMKLAMENFARINRDIKDVVAEASDGDKRREWKKLEDEIDSLRKKLAAVGKIDPTQTVEIAQLQDTFVTDVETPFLATHKWFIGEFKNSAIVPEPPRDTSSSSTRSNVLTKRESVPMPSFYGDTKKLPFLTYPTWRAEWDSLIVDYEEKVRPTVLKTHLDEVAKSRFIGYERDYNEMMNRLDVFYGDPLKVIECVMKEVVSPSAIREGDYKGLISFTDILENNFNRLKCMCLEHEMSNTTTMTSVLVKFPRSVTEKWAEHLITLDKSERSRPFESLIEWLQTQKQIWENVDALNVAKGVKPTASFYSNGAPPPPLPKSGMRCYRCGEEGHRKFDCPSRKSGGGNAGGGKDQKTPKKPCVKKFWCAFHRDDATTRCSSVSCQELRQEDAAKRIQLLKDNGDCIHCCGDHKPEDCSRKGRLCGGGKQDRGCTQTHCINELFCPKAKCFSIQQVHSVDTDDAEGVVLLIMNVSVTKSGKSASVFWDLGCSSNFVREEFAKQMGFSGKEEHLCVTTLGNVTTDYHVITYTCSMLDVNGEEYEFKAYGMDSITGALTRIGEGLVKKFFPHLPHDFVSKLLRRSKVDFLIGMKHPSWHPDKAERSQEGGDIWLYRGIFGTCVGGRHPNINEETRRSDSLFSVNFVYHANVNRVEEVPHSLVFCPERVAHYVHKTGYCENAYFGKSICSSSLARVQPSMQTIVEEESTEVDESSTSSSVTLESDRSGILPSKQSSCHSTKTALMKSEELFYRCEALGTAVNPQCGACRCGNCPIAGSKYSYSEQKGLEMIQKNLRYDAVQRRYYTVYPWLVPRSTLPKNDKIAYQSLVTLERNLSRNPELAAEFCAQIEDMVKRGAAVVLSQEQLDSWEGDYYFIPLLGVKGKKWLRVCCDASRRQGGYPSINDCVHKGPDRFINNILSVWIGFRNGRVGCRADISKFHNKVYLVEPDIHM